MKLIDWIVRTPACVALGHRDTSARSLTVTPGTDTVALAPMLELPGATGFEAGVMSATDKTKLDGLQNTTVAVDPAHFDSRAQVTATVISDPLVLFLRTAGYTTPGDGGGALYRRVASEPVHTGKVQSADGGWWELSAENGLVTPEQFGAQRDGSANDAPALAGCLQSADFPFIRLTAGVYRTATTLTIEESTFRIDGAGWFYDKDNTPLGATIQADATAMPVDTMVFQSTDPSMANDTRVDGLALRDFAIEHTGTGTGLVIDNLIRTDIQNLYVRCNGLGAIGIKMSNFCFFVNMQNVTVNSFTDRGIVVDAAGSQHILRNVSSISGKSSATAALEIRQPGFVVDGGQYNVNDGNRTGIGILANNIAAGDYFGGRILHTLHEADTGIKITGTTNPFRDVIVERPYMNGTIGTTDKLVVFDRAKDCLLIHPQTPNASSLTAVVEWTDLSVNCGMISTAQAMVDVPLIVDPAATNPWVKVEGVTPSGDHLRFHDDPTLTILCDFVERLGPTRRTNGVWDRGLLLMASDTAETIALPYEGGRLAIFCDRSQQQCGEVFFRSGASGAITAGATGSNFTVDTTPGILTGTDGTVGEVTIRYNRTDGLIYFENRRTGFATFKFEINGVIY